jgi:hypothetical protein
MVESCNEKNCSKVLLDVRNMPGQIKMMDIYHVVNYAKKTRSQGIKTALLGTNKQVRADKLLNILAYNRGVQANAFKDIKKALQWLKEDG